MNEKENKIWDKYIATLDTAPNSPNIELSMAGNEKIADELLHLYLEGKKTAGSGLVKDYELAGDELPKVGNYWIILSSSGEPKCIVKTVKVEFNRFKDIPIEIAIAEGEGDLSLNYWRKAHIEFFTPYLNELGIADLEEEQVVTEFFEVVYKDG